MGKMRRLIYSRLGVWMGGAAGLLFLATVAVGHAATKPPKTGRGSRSPFMASNSVLPRDPKSSVKCGSTAPRGQRPGQDGLPGQPLIAPRSRKKKSTSEARRDTGLTCGQGLRPKRRCMLRKQQVEVKTLPFLFRRGGESLTRPWLGGDHSRRTEDHVGRESETHPALRIG